MFKGLLALRLAVQPETAESAVIIATMRGRIRDAVGHVMQIDSLVPSHMKD